MLSGKSLINSLKLLVINKFYWKMFFGEIGPFPCLVLL